MRRIAVLSAIAVVVVAAAAAFLAGNRSDAPRADATNANQVKSGGTAYAQHCAACHGVNLEGQPDWRKRKADGRLPAPPHDITGHTWEHSDEVLFRVTKEGFRSYAGANYQTDMPAFGAVLTDQEIWDVLAFIKSRWPEHVRKRHATHEANIYKRAQEQPGIQPAASSAGP